MKTKSTNIILSLAFVLIAFNAQAQSWLTTGNSGTHSNTNFLGTKDSASLVFRTFNQERMRVSYTGRVGIGTKSPTQPLDVHGNINTDAALYATKVGIGTKTPTQALDVHGNIDITDTLIFPGRYTSAKMYYDGNSLNITTLYQGSVSIGSPNQSSTALGVVSAENAISAYSHDISIESFSDNPYHDDFLASGLLGRSNGALGVAALSDSSYGIYATTGNTKSYAGYFDGSIYTTGVYTGSDEQLKQNIQDVSSAMSIINKLHPKSYQFRHDNDYKLMKLPQGQHYGLIAQDVEKVLPNLVKETKFNTGGSITQNAVFDSKTSNQKTYLKSAPSSKEISFKALNYTELIPLLIKGMQEQQQSIEELKQQNQQLIKIIETKLGISVTSKVKTATLSSASLLNNVPNPYKSSTSISYNLPAKFSFAQIVITDNSGKVLKQINVSGSGKGSVNIEGSSLAAGSYNYSLLIDGRIIDTKQMVLQK